MFLLFLLAGRTSNAQTIVFEKTFGSPYASFEPNASAMDEEGNVFITGRYDTSVEFFKNVNGKTVLADTSLPYGPLMFVYKINSEGKMLRRIFLNALEGMDIIVTKEGNVLATGFMNRYRDENYNGDKTQGVCLFLLTKELDMLGRNIYPSYYNSVPYKLLETSENKILIVAHSLIYKDTIQGGIFDTDGNRMIVTDKNGTMLQDTILRMRTMHNNLDFDYNKIYARRDSSILPVCSVYDVKEIKNGFLFFAAAYGRPPESSFLLFETDKNFK